MNKKISYRQDSVSLESCLIKVREDSHTLRVMRTYAGKSIK